MQTWKMLFLCVFRGMFVAQADFTTVLVSYSRCSNTDHVIFGCIDLFWHTNAFLCAAGSQCCSVHLVRRDGLHFIQTRVYILVMIQFIGLLWFAINFAFRFAYFVVRIELL